MKQLFSLLSIFALMTAVTSGADNHLPSRDPSIVLPLLKSISKDPGIDDIKKILGNYDKDVGSGVYMLIYRLDDGSSLSVWGGSLKKLSSITLMRAGRENVDIYKSEKKPNEKKPNKS